MAGDMATVNLGPAPLDMTGVRAGDRNAVGVAITASDAPFDLTGYVITAQARDTAIGTIVVNAVIENISAAAGTFRLRWPGEDVRALFTGAQVNWAGVWDLQIKKAGEDPITVAAGIWAAQMDVTKP